jgi:hypothetical protein
MRSRHAREREDDPLLADIDVYGGKAPIGHVVKIVP